MPEAPPFDLATALVRLFESVRQGLFFGRVDPESALTLAINPHLKLMLGLAPETPDRDIELFGCGGPGGFMDRDTRDVLLERLGRDGAVNDLLLRLRRADGSALWVEMTAHAQPAGSDGGLDVSAVLRDVTERKRLDDQGRELYQQLLQSEKLAALGQTVSGVAHELNNPLATILASAERLAKQPVDPAIRRGLETILGEAERSARIVRNLLTFARKRHTTRAMVDVNQIVRDTLALRQYEQGSHNIAVVEALAGGLPPVFADPHQVQQVLLNLVINAEQAMLGAHGRGTLVIRTWQDPDHDVVVIEVNDDGPGVPEEAAAKIFDPFFTTKSAGQGTGLGLTVACAIVQEHGGRLTVKSGSTQGASFFVELPTGGTGHVASPRAPEMVAPDAGHRPPGPRRRGRGGTRRGSGGRTA